MMDQIVHSDSKSCHLHSLCSNLKVLRMWCCPSMGQKHEANLRSVCLAQQENPNKGYPLARFRPNSLNQRRTGHARQPYPGHAIIRFRLPLDLSKGTSESPSNLSGLLLIMDAFSQFLAHPSAMLLTLDTFNFAQYMLMLIPPPKARSRINIKRRGLRMDTKVRGTFAP